MKKIVILMLALTSLISMRAEEIQPAAANSNTATESQITMQACVQLDNTVSMTLTVQLDGTIKTIEIKEIKNNNLATTMPQLKAELHKLTGTFLLPISVSSTILLCRKSAQKKLQFSTKTVIIETVDQLDTHIETITKKALNAKKNVLTAAFMALGMITIA